MILEIIEFVVPYPYLTLINFLNVKTYKTMNNMYQYPFPFEGKVKLKLHPSKTLAAKNLMLFSCPKPIGPILEEI